MRKWRGSKRETIRESRERNYNSKMERGSCEEVLGENNRKVEWEYVAIKRNAE